MDSLFLVSFLFLLSNFIYGILITAFSLLINYVRLLVFILKHIRKKVAYVDRRCIPAILNFSLNHTFSKV